MNKRVCLIKGRTGAGNNVSVPADNIEDNLVHIAEHQRKDHEII